MDLVPVTFEGLVTMIDFYLPVCMVISKNSVFEELMCLWMCTCISAERCS